MAGMRAAVKKDNLKRQNRQQKEMQRLGLVENKNKKEPDPTKLRQFRDPKVQEPQEYRRP